MEVREGQKEVTHSEGAVFSCWSPGGVFCVRMAISAFFSSWVEREMQLDFHNMYNTSMNHLCIENKED